MGWFHTKLLTGLFAFCIVTSPVAGQGKESAPAPAPAKPEVKNPLEDETPNPLTEVDPFAGEFEGDEVIVVVKVAGDGYVGEIRRAGRSFQLKAVRDGKQLTGTFTHESTPFKFTAGFEGPALKLATGSKVFLLKRRDNAAGPGPAPQPPITQSPTSPAPTPPPTRPTVPVPNPTAPRPTATDAKPAPMPLPVDYTKLSSQQLADAVWTRFPADAYVVVEDTSSSSRSIGSIARKKLVYAGATNGKPVVRSHPWQGKEWGKADPPAPVPKDDCSRADELGYTKGQTRAETLTLAGKSLSCQATTFTGEVAGKDAAMKLTLTVWRSSQVDHPSIMLDLPGQRLLVEPDLVRVIIESEYKGFKASMDLQLAELAREVQIGDQLVTCTVIQGEATSDLLTAQSAVAKSVLKTEYWLSHQVPGGVVRRTETDDAGTRHRSMERSVVEFSQGK